MDKRSHKYCFERSCERSISDKTYVVSYKLYIFKIHFTAYQIYIYPTRKMLKEVAFPTLNLPQESASSTTKPRPVNAIEKREEYQLLQEQNARTRTGFHTANQESYIDKKLEC